MESCLKILKQILAVQVKYTTVYLSFELFKLLCLGLYCLLNLLNNPLNTILKYLLVSCIGSAIFNYKR